MFLSIWIPEEEVRHVLEYNLLFNLFAWTGLPGNHPGRKDMGDNIIKEQIWIAAEGSCTLEQIDLLINKYTDKITYPANKKVRSQKLLAQAVRQSQKERKFLANVNIFYMKTITDFRKQEQRNLSLLSNFCNRDISCVISGGAFLQR